MGKLLESSVITGRFQTHCCFRIGTGVHFLNLQGAEKDVELARVTVSFLVKPILTDREGLGTTPRGGKIDLTKKLIN
jgi:hypothetical protein